MKITIIISTSLTLILIAFYMILYNQSDLSRDSELVNITLDRGARIVKRKYNLIPIGSGASMPGGPIKKLSLSFNTKRPHSKEELRGLLIKAAKELVDLVNENQEIQQYIKEPPFTIKNVDIVIFNRDIDNGRVFDPNIAVADINECILTYRTVDKDASYGYKREFKETYEEALRALSSAALKSPSPQEKI